MARNLFCLLQKDARHIGRGVAQGKAFKARSHLGHLAQFGYVEFGDAKAAPRFALCQTLGLQLAEGLAHRDMAGAELGAIWSCRSRAPGGISPEMIGRQGAGDTADWVSSGACFMNYR
nr:hypothetical protein [Paracoccus versutus]